MSDFFKSIDEMIDTKELNKYSPLVLAYIGDAVYEVYIRTWLMRKGGIPVHRIHKEATNYVRAQAQAKVVHRIADLLTPEESDIVRRGRNSKSGTLPKNANVTEYKYATGFEALIGYLYMKKENERLFEILSMAVNENIERVESKGDK